MILTLMVSYKTVSAALFCVFACCFIDFFFNYFGCFFPQKTIDKQSRDIISMEDFRAIYRALVHRPEFEELFKAYSTDGLILPDGQLLKFLVKEQFQTEANETTALEVIMKYEPIDEGMHSLTI